MSYPKNQHGDSWIPLFSLGCDHCGQLIGNLGTSACDSPIKFYHCDICGGDDFDVCCHCFEVHGKRCDDGTHILHSREIAGLWFSSSRDLDDVLTSCGARPAKRSTGLGRATLARYSGFFQTNTGWRGGSSTHIRIGDILAVIFGSRVPFILRKHASSSSYCLISSCDVPDCMSGEAVALWKDGQLRGEDFDIV